MPEEIKKVLVVALEGVSGGDVYDTVEAGKLPNVKRLMAEGATLVGIVADASAASSWATLATGTHAITHGVTGEDACQAEYIWQAAEKASKRGLLLGYPASTPPQCGDEHPDDLLKPPSRDAAYYERVGSYLLSSPDWDIAFVRVPTSMAGLHDADEAIGKVLDAADFETLRVLVAVADGGGDALAVLAGPGVKQGAVVKRPLELADLAPTICYLAELPVPAECEGGIVYQALEDPDAKLLELQACRRNYERLRRSSGRGPMC